MNALEQAELEKNEKARWKLVSYSATRYTFFLDEGGNPIMVREEALTGPNKGAVKEQGCTTCVSPLHHNGQASLDLSVAAYWQSGGRASDWLFQGHFNWLDVQDTVNLNDDFISLAWVGNQRLDWNNLRLVWEDGSSTTNDYYTEQVFPNEGVVMGFPEWKPWGSMGAYKAAKEGFASAHVYQNIFQGLAGNVVVKYHHTWKYVTTQFTLSGGSLPSITFGTSDGKWEKSDYTGFSY